MAHRVHVNFPWGRLLRDVVLADGETLDSVRRVCRPGAEIRIVLTYSAGHESKIVRALSLPDLGEAHIDGVLAPAYRERGLSIGERRRLSPAEVGEAATTWSKRLLSGGRERDVWLIRAIAV